MNRRVVFWSRLAPMLGLLAVSGCLARMENSVDLLFSVGAQENLLRAPLSGAVGALSYLVARFVNLL